MSALDELADKIADEELRAQIKQEISHLAGQKKFGLVYEEHHEAVEGVYPCLERIDEVSRDPGGDLWHVLIEGENYHALQLLGYAFAGKVDCIYIDPPYNTGARDWKYTGTASGYRLWRGGWGLRGGYCLKAVASSYRLMTASNQS